MRTERVFAYLAAIAGVVAAGGIFLPLHDYVQGKPGAVAFVQLIAVVLVALRWGAGPGIVAALLGVAVWQFLFLPPYFAFKPTLQVADAALAGAYTAAALIVALLAGRVGTQRRQAEAEHEETRRMYRDLQRASAERERAAADLQQRAQELAMLQAAAVDFAAASDVSQLVDTIAQRAMALLNVTAGWVSLFDESCGELEAAASQGIGVSVLRGARIPLDEGTLGRAIAEKRTLYVNDYDNWPHKSTRFTRPMAAVMTAPMYSAGGSSSSGSSSSGPGAGGSSAGRLVGIIGVAESKPGFRFTDADAALLSTFALQAAGILSQARQLAEAQRHAAELAHSEARSRRLIDSNVIGALFGNIDGAVTDANEAFLQMTGYTREDVAEGRVNWFAITPPEFRPDDERALAELQASGRCTPYEKELVRKNGSRVPVLLGAALFDGSKRDGVAFVLDLTERKRAEERVRFLAQHDSLTGLPNRVEFEDRVNHAIGQARRHHREVAVLFIDLDFFKRVNDSLGHQAGDKLLLAVARRLQQCLREGDTVARLGGDEFVFSLPMIEGANDAAIVAQRAIQALARPFDVDGHELHLSGSVGIGMYPSDGEDAEALLRAADVAMYHAKHQGRNNFQFFAPWRDRPGVTLTVVPGGRGSPT
jgi:diguanylate cyclase (GGDEF)-like protein/PAS domain S-box-containing protein